jgi:hypothetical protein
MWISLVFIVMLMIPIAGILAGTAASTKKRQAKLDLIRLAIEKGQTLDPALIDKLMPAKIKMDQPTPAQAATGLRIGGVMCLAVAVGLPILGYCLISIDPRAFPALQGVGGLVACISMGLFVASKIVLSSSKDTDHTA